MANPYLCRPLCGEYKHVKLFGSFWIEEIMDLASKWGPLLEPKLEPPTVRAHCTLVAMPTCKTWIHPADDERCDASVYKSHSEKDRGAIGA